MEMKFLPCIFTFFLSFLSGSRAQVNYTYLSSLPTKASRETALRTEILSSYDPSVVPQETPGEPVEVQVQLRIFEASQVAAEDQSITLGVWLRTQWKDFRLAWNDTDLDVGELSFRTDLDGKTIWLPDIEVYNLRTSIKDTTSTTDAQVWPDGTVFYSRPGRLEATCNFKGLSNFPYDRLSCIVELGGWSKSGLYVNYTMLNGGVEGPAIARYREFTLEQPPRTFAEIENQFYPCCADEPWPVLKVTMSFRRASRFYTFTIVFPSCLFAVLSMAVFFLSPANGERLSFGITLILAMVAQELISNSYIPTCDEWLWIHGLLLGNQLFALTSLCESCLVLRFYYLNDDDVFTKTGFVKYWKMLRGQGKRNKKTGRAWQGSGAIFGERNAELGVGSSCRLPEPLLSPRRELSYGHEQNMIPLVYPHQQSSMRRGEGNRSLVGGGGWYAGGSFDYIESFRHNNEGSYRQNSGAVHRHNSDGSIYQHCEGDEREREGMFGKGDRISNSLHSVLSRGGSSFREERGREEEKAVDALTSNNLVDQQKNLSSHLTSSKASSHSSSSNSLPPPISSIPLSSRLPNANSLKSKEDIMRGRRGSTDDSTVVGKYYWAACKIQAGFRRYCAEQKSLDLKLSRDEQRAQERRDAALRRISEIFASVGLGSSRRNKSERQTRDTDERAWGRGDYNKEPIPLRRVSTSCPRPSVGGESTREGENKKGAGVTPKVDDDNVLDVYIDNEKGSGQEKEQNKVGGQEKEHGDKSKHGEGRGRQRGEKERVGSWKCKQAAIGVRRRSQHSPFDKVVELSNKVQDQQTTKNQGEDESKEQKSGDRKENGQENGLEVGNDQREQGKRRGWSVRRKGSYDGSRRGSSLWGAVSDLVIGSVHAARHHNTRKQRERHRQRKRSARALYLDAHQMKEKYMLLARQIDGIAAIIIMIAYVCFIISMAVTAGQIYDPLTGANE